MVSTKRQLRGGEQREAHCMGQTLLDVNSPQDGVGLRKASPCATVDQQSVPQRLERLLVVRFCLRPILHLDHNMIDCHFEDAVFLGCCVSGSP